MSLLVAAVLSTSLLVNNSTIRYQCKYFGSSKQVGLNPTMSHLRIIASYHNITRRTGNPFTNETARGRAQKTATNEGSSLLPALLLAHLLHYDMKCCWFVKLQTKSALNCCCHQQQDCLLIECRPPASVCVYARLSCDLDLAPRWP